MSDRRQALLLCFRECAGEVYADLVRRYALRALDGPPGELTLASERCRLELSLGTGHVADLGVTLAPASGGRAFGLGPVLEALDDPAAAFASRALLDAAALAAELKRAAGLLERFCDGPLRGDFSAWPAIAAEIAHRLDAWERRPKGRDARQAPWLVRDAARLAYGREEWAEAAKLYASLGDGLSPSERRRLEYARQRAGTAG